MSVDQYENAASNVVNSGENNIENNNENDVFMKEFKYFKKFKDLNEIKSSNSVVLEINDLESLSNNHVLTLFSRFQSLNAENQQFLDKYNSLITNYGLKEPNKWKFYELTNSPGLILIKNPFKPGYQRYFVKKCLNDYQKLPYKTNLDLHISRDLNTNLWLEAIKEDNFKEFNKLRWVTFGYHYNWTDKVYNNDDFTAVPTDIDNISRLIAGLIGYEDYSPQAGIINFYHLNSTLSAHTDHSEENMNAPLISISFGNPAIFLIGDDTKTTKPTAVLIRSGDIVIMSKKSRLAYHAVPKIFKEDTSHYFTYSNENDDKTNEFYVNDEEWSNYLKYIDVNRINLNIRQVF